MRRREVNFGGVIIINGWFIEWNTLRLGYGITSWVTLWVSGSFGKDLCLSWLPRVHPEQGSGLGDDWGRDGRSSGVLERDSLSLEAEETRLSDWKGDLAAVDGDFDLVPADLKSACFLPTCSEDPERKDPVVGENGSDAAPGLDEAMGEEGAWVQKTTMVLDLLWFMFDVLALNGFISCFATGRLWLWIPAILRLSFYDKMIKLHFSWVSVWCGRKVWVVVSYPSSMWNVLFEIRFESFSVRYIFRGISEDVEYKHRGMVLWSRIFSISCLEMLETSALGLGQDLGFMSTVTSPSAEQTCFLRSSWTTSNFALTSSICSFGAAAVCVIFQSVS